MAQQFPGVTIGQMLGQNVKTFSFENFQKMFHSCEKGKLRLWPPGAALVNTSAPIHWRPSVLHGESFPNLPFFRVVVMVKNFRFSPVNVMRLFSFGCWEHAPQSQMTFDGPSRWHFRAPCTEHRRLQGSLRCTLACKFSMSESGGNAPKNKPKKNKKKTARSNRRVR